MLALFTMIEPEHRGVQLTDALMEQVAKGDRAAFAQLYEKTRHALYCYLLAIVKQAAAAEDLMQDTYVAVYRHIDSYRPQGKPMAWVFTIARNLAYMELRKAGSQVALEDCAPQEEQGGDATLQAVDAMVLRAALSHLSEEERQIVLLKAVMGYKFREIAQSTGLPAGTVRSSYSRSMKKLQKILNEEGR